MLGGHWQKYWRSNITPSMHLRVHSRLCHCLQFPPIFLKCLSAVNGVKVLAYLNIDLGYESKVHRPHMKTKGKFFSWYTFFSTYIFSHDHNFGEYNSFVGLLTWHWRYSLPQHLYFLSCAMKNSCGISQYISSLAISRNFINISR